MFLVVMQQVIPQGFLENVEIWDFKNWCMEKLNESLKAIHSDNNPVGKDTLRVRSK